MKLYDLGHVPWLDSQLIYHALPRLGEEGLIFLTPAQPYVCIGYHQDAAQEVDLDYCRQEGIPVFRREVGGGAVYLDGNQLFYQLVMHRQNPLAPKDKEEFYRQLLVPVVQTYRDLGVPTRYKAVNDILTVKGQKISGNGVAEIGDYLILVGNLIAEFDYQRMARVLRVPDVKFRDKLYKSLRENLTTLRRELGQAPDEQHMKDRLRENFAAVLGELEPAPLPEGLQDQLAALAQSHTTKEWLLKPGQRTPGERQVKVASGVHVTQRLHKAPGGLIRATVETRGEEMLSVALSGDFFFYPAHKLADLERHLAGVRRGQAEARIRAFYQAQGVESPGVTPANLAAALGDS